MPAWYEREEKWLEAQKAMDVIYKYRKSNQDAGLDYCDVFKAHETPADEAVEDARRWVPGALPCPASAAAQLPYHMVPCYHHAYACCLQHKTAECTTTCCFVCQEVGSCPVLPGIHAFAGA